jgi:hypothetical protein
MSIAFIIVNRSITSASYLVIYGINLTTIEKRLGDGETGRNKWSAHCRRLVLDMMQHLNPLPTPNSQLLVSPISG